MLVTYVSPNHVYIKTGVATIFFFMLNDLSWAVQTLGVLGLEKMMFWLRIPVFVISNTAGNCPEGS